jgi:ribosomal protein L11 methyltransferase
MKWSEISIQTSHEAIDAVAEIFHDLGASGVVIEDPELINTYRS